MTKFEENTLTDYLKEISRHQHLKYFDRASVALKSLLLGLENKAESKTIAVPSFLCHAPVSAIVAAGWKPYFLDTSLESAQVTSESLLLAKKNGVKVFLWVHMFGLSNESEIYRNLAKEPGFFVIEDACLSLGAKSFDSYCGAFGNVSLYSFGPTKNLYLGGGGAIVYSEDSLLFKIECEKTDLLKESHFKVMFYEALQTFRENDDSSSLKGLIEAYIPYLPTTWDMSNRLKFNRHHFDVSLKSRMEKFQMYESSLKGTNIHVFKSKNMTPWRFVFRIPGLNRQEQNTIATYLKEHGLDVSSWYVPCHLMVDMDCHSDSLKNTETLSNEIFQLWLDESISIEKIKINCEILIRCLRRVLQ